MQAAQTQRKYTDKWKLRPQSELVVILEDLDFSWFKSEIATVKMMWQSGQHITNIAKAVERDQDEVALLIMHLARCGKIKKRKTGVFGC